MLLSAKMTLPAVLSVIRESIPIAIIRSIPATVTVVAAATTIIGRVEGRGSTCVIFGSHHFVHWRNLFARADLGRGHNRLLVAVDHTDWGNGYRRGAANQIVARPHAANSRGLFCRPDQCSLTNSYVDNNSSLISE
jgi:hypothetical protein